MDIAAGLASFAAKIQESAGTLSRDPGSVCGIGSALFELAASVDDVLAELRGRAAEDGAAVIAAAEAAEAAEAARLDARDAAAEAAQALDAEEFSASGVSNSNLDAAIDALAVLAADARSWSDRHGRALDRLAPAAKVLSELRNRTTTTAESPGGAPMLRAAPLAASLALSRELPRGGGEHRPRRRIAPRRPRRGDGQSRRRARAIQRVGARQPAPVVPGIRSTRGVGQGARGGARGVGRSGFRPGFVRAPSGDAVETFRRLVDEARPADESGAVSWARYCAASGAWHERESRTLPSLRANVDAAAKECERHAAAGARRWDQSFRQTVDRVFREMRS